MQGRVIEGGRLSGWETRQPLREDSGNGESGAMSNTERSRLKRERDAEQRKLLKQNDMQCDATQRDATEAEGKPIGVLPLKEKINLSGGEPWEVDFSENSEKIEKPEKPPALASPSAPPPAKNPTGSRLPEAWVLPKAWGEWALAQCPAWSDDRVLQVPESFRDYWVAKAGANARKADWQATWRNWVRRESALPQARALPLSLHEKRAATIAELTGQNRKPEGTIIDVTPSATALD
jgi:hypothetical protein